MRLSSARELKNRLIAREIQPLRTGPLRADALAIAARRLADLDPSPRTVALGVSRVGPGQFRLAVRVQNQALLDHAVVARITRAARGEVDLRYVGRVVKRQWHRGRIRPLAIGASIGHHRVTAGTLGAFVLPRRGRLPRILSNNHVLADENRAQRGDPILQPGAFDGGRRPADVVGTLERFVRLTVRGANSVDAAIAVVDDGVEVDELTLRDLGTVTGVVTEPVETGEEVAKIGRTTGLTQGRVTAFELDNLVVGYDRGNFRFDDQLEIEGSGEEPFSQGGDSGSLIVDAEGRAVALLFAGSDQGGTNGRGLTYANPIARVLDALRVRFPEIPESESGRRP